MWSGRPAPGKQTKTLGETLARHEIGLLSRWLFPVSNGIVEGMNFKVNFLVRRSFGFRTYDVIETALYHQFGDLPEPKFTHSFW